MQKKWKKMNIYTPKQGYIVKSNSETTPHIPHFVNYKIGHKFRNSYARML